MSGCGDRTGHGGSHGRFAVGFEVGEGIVGWGSMAFLALPHLVEEPVDWRGPHQLVRVPAAWPLPAMPVR